MLKYHFSPIYIQVQPFRFRFSEYLVIVVTCYNCISPSEVVLASMKALVWSKGDLSIVAEYLLGEPVFYIIIE